MRRKNHKPSILEKTIVIPMMVLALVCFFGGFHFYNRWSGMASSPFRNPSKCSCASWNYCLSDIMVLHQLHQTNQAQTYD